MGQAELANTVIDVKEIRKMFNLSVGEFAMRYGFRAGDVKRWESGDSAPNGADRTLLIVLERIPDEVTEALSVS